MRYQACNVWSDGEVPVNTDGMLNQDAKLC